MNATYLILEIKPTAEGADLLFGGPGSANPSLFSINTDHGIVSLQVTLDLCEPRVLECKQEATNANKVSGGKLPSRPRNR